MIELVHLGSDAGGAHALAEYRQLKR